jgi:acyl dehydratase
MAAGLPDIILHGTATLALAVSEVLRREGAGPGRPVSRIAGRFAAMVRMPSTLTVLGQDARAADGGRWLGFQVVGQDARPVIREGWVLVRDRRA